MLAFGLMFGIIAGGPLVQERFANAPWRHAAAVFVAWATGLCALWVLLRILEVRDLPSRPPSGEIWAFLLAVSWGLGGWLRDYFGVASVVCFATAGYLWWCSKGRRRGCTIAVAGWLCAGCYPLVIPWSNEHRLLLGMVVGGVATALQGILDVVAFLRGKTPEWSQSVATPAG